MATVLLGSEAPKAPVLGAQATVNGDEARSDTNAQLPPKTVVIIDTPDFDEEGNRVPLDKRLLEIRNAFSLHSEKAASWVEGVDEGFTNSVSQVFDCPVGRPDNWDNEVREQASQPTGTPTVSEVEVNPNDGVVS